MKFTAAILSLALAAFTVNAVAVDNAEHSMLSKLFKRDISARDDPCLTPCYEKTGSYCPSPGGCGLQCWVCCEVKHYAPNACG